MLQQVPKRLIQSSATSVSRLAHEKLEVAGSLDAGLVKEHLDGVTKPNTLSSSVKTVGIALIAAPDPFTGIPGVALLASSYALKRRDPANLGHLAQETRKLLREMSSLSL